MLPWVRFGRTSGKELDDLIRSYEFDEAGFESSFGEWWSYISILNYILKAILFIFIFILFRSFILSYFLYSIFLILCF